MRNVTYQWDSDGQFLNDPVPPGSVTPIWGHDL
jgi:hypothetical protein